MIYVFIRCSSLLLLLGFVMPAFSELTEAELQKWFYSDDFELPMDRVNEGDLVFLDQMPAKLPLQSKNTFIIDEESLATGWVQLEQCYSNLDAVKEAEVVYQFKFIRDLKVLSKQNIDRAFVQGASVQLERVVKPATLCVSAEVNNLYELEEGGYSLNNGPYLRKFLDGYYPYHLMINIQFPDGLRYVRAEPDSQQGFLIDRKPNRVSVDTVFEGKLFTRFYFVPR